jgi:hypothetical protein
VTLRKGIRWGKASIIMRRRDEAWEKWKETNLEYSNWNASVISIREGITSRGKEATQTRRGMGGGNLYGV